MSKRFSICSLALIVLCLCSSTAYAFLGFYDRVFVDFVNTDPSHALTVEVSLPYDPDHVSLVCPSSSLKISRSSQLYSLTIPPGYKGESTDNLCYLSLNYWYRQDSGYYKKIPPKNLSISAFYRGAVVAQTTLYLYYTEDESSKAYLNYPTSNPDCQKYPSILPTLSVNSVAKRTNSQLFPASSQINSQYTVGVAYGGVDYKLPFCKSSVGYGPAQPAPLNTLYFYPYGISQIDNDLSYVEVVNTTQETLYWGYTDNYPYYTSTESIAQMSPTAVTNSYLPIQPGKTSYIKVPKTDSYTVGIQSARSLFYITKSSDSLFSDGVHENGGSYHSGVIQFVPTSPYYQSLPSFVGESGPLSVCSNANIKGTSTIDLVDGATFQLVVYDPTTSNKPESCYDAGPNNPFSDAGWHGGPQ